MHLIERMLYRYNGHYYKNIYLVVYNTIYVITHIAIRLNITCVVQTILTYDHVYNAKVSCANLDQEVGQRD